MLNWLRGDADVNAMIQKRQYNRAAKALEAQIRDDPESVFLRQQLADVLVRKGDRQRAVDILFALVDEFADKGFVAKGLALLKKVQRIDADAAISDRLTRLVKEGRAMGYSSPLTPAGGWDVSESSGSMPGPEPAEDQGPRSVTVTPATETTDTGSVSTSVTSELIVADQWLQEAEKRDDFHWSPLFDRFTSDEVAEIFGRMRLLVKKPGSIIYTEGEPGRSFYVLANGSARVYQRDPLGHNDQLAVLRSGDFFGTASVLDGRAREYTITAALECELIEIDTETFDHIAARRPDVRMRIEMLRDVPVIA
ncbi:MAG: cyclic nucleotide-binding domain-containing protein [Acidobacteriota bacterium]